MSDRSPPKNYHALYDVGARAARGAVAPGGPPDQTPGHQRMAAAVPAAVVNYDTVTLVPVQVMTRAPAAPPGAAPARATGPEQAALAWVKQWGDLWRLSDDDADTIEVVAVSRTGLPTVRLIQRVGGREVFNSDVSVALTRSNEVVGASGQFFEGAAAAPAADRAAATTAEEAIAKAAADLTGLTFTAAAFRPETAGPDAGGYRLYQYAPGGPSPAEFERPVRVKNVLFPLGPGQFTPGYYLELWIKGFPVFAYVLDTEGTPDLLYRKNLTSPLTFKYRVHNTGDTVFRPEDGPAPGTPHPTGTPDGFQAPTISEKLIELESLLPSRPWLPDTAETTRGNNCLAYADLGRPDGISAGDVFGKVSGTRTFDYTYDHSKGADNPTNLQASLVGMFFHVNWLHDRWYEAGFDEAAGNAQQDKFGLGGLDGDPIRAEGNDFSGTDNANMVTPPVGSSPRMQMFLFNGPRPEFPSRTSNHEALITFHEMGHYITNRLVANARGLDNLQGRAMGEGWGDFFAICMTSQATDNFATGVFAAGGWTDVRPDFKDNYYFSIRRYPYSADVGKNPLTFKHIGDGVLLPSGPPRHPDVTGPNSEEHNAGEVWCGALWEVFVNLVVKHGHAEAERRVLQYVIGGLKQTPARPTFTQARDGIIAAVTALDAADLPQVWAGFAKRGMGAGAVSPASNSTTLTGVVESFTTP
jgi:hypothetical protein